MTPITPLSSPLLSATLHDSAPLVVMYNFTAHPIDPQIVPGDAKEFLKRLQLPTHAQEIQDPERGKYYEPFSVDEVAFPLVLLWLRKGKLPADLPATALGRLKLEAECWGMDKLKGEAKEIYWLREKARRLRKGGTTAMDKYVKLNAIAPDLSDARIAHKLDRALQLDGSSRLGLRAFITNGYKGPAGAFDPRFLQAAREKTLDVGGLVSVHALLETPVEQQLDDVRRVVGELDALKKAQPKDKTTAEMHEAALKKLISMSKDLAELRAMKEGPHQKDLTPLLAERILEFSQTDDDVLFGAAAALNSGAEGRSLFERLRYVDFTKPENRAAVLVMLRSYTLSYQRCRSAAWLCHTMGTTFEEFTNAVTDKTASYFRGEHSDEYYSKGERKRIAKRNEKRLEKLKKSNLEAVLKCWKEIDASVTTASAGAGNARAAERRAALAQFEADYEASKVAGPATAAAEKKRFWKFGR